jgi:deoxyribonuclease (pyrimidine dimer)
MRINVIDPRLLLDQHLVAEYREIKMLPKAFIRTLRSRLGLIETKIPTEYVLGKGHGYFFYDKLLYIEERFEAILKEIKLRGFTTNFTSLYDENFDYSLDVVESFKAYNSYNPTYKDCCVNVSRIIDRFDEVDNFYRYYGRLISKDEVLALYSKYLPKKEHLCDSCVTQNCIPGKKDKLQLLVSQCSFYESKKVIGDPSTNFSSRFMPNVKFQAPVNGYPSIDYLEFLTPYYGCYYTSKTGDSIICVDGGRHFDFEVFEKLDKKQVSIYEAIPELIPEGMRYDKELDKLVPIAFFKPRFVKARFRDKLTSSYTFIVRP